MLHSKATAALMRLKEIDKKYKMRNEGRYTVNSSTESTLSSPSAESPHSIGDHNKLKTLQVPLKSKLDVRMPKMYIEEEEEEEEEDKSHSITKEKVSSTIVINVETKSSENVEKELSKDSLTSVIETDEKTDEKTVEKTSKKFEEKEDPKNTEEKSIEIDEKTATASEVNVKMKKKEAEIVTNVSDINTRSNTSSVSSEIEELESPVDEQPANYVNDTFEEALSTTLSTMKSRDDVHHTEKSVKSEEKIEDNVRFVVKKIDIVSSKDSTMERQEEISNEKQIIELVPPKLMENTSECDIDLNKELSNYVKTIENIDDDVSDITPVRLLKPSKQPETFLKTRRKKYKRPPISKDSSQNDKTTTESLTTSKNNRRSVEHTSFTPINGTKRMEKVHEENNSNIHEKTKFKQNFQWNVEEKKNKLPDERERVTINENPAKSCSNDRPWAVKNFRTQSKPKKKKSKTRTLHRPSKTTDFNKDKFLRFDSKQIHCLRKQISKLTAEINLDNGSSKKSDRMFFKPLDFPNIASYTSPDMDTFKLMKQNPYIGLYEKLAMIRQWLKDQYIFYQVRSNLVEIINEKHVPMSLEDAKTVIRELQKMTVEAR